MTKDKAVKGSKMSDEPSKIRHIQRSRSLHRFLWAWIGLVYLWGLLHLFVPNPGVFKCWYNAVLPERCPPLQFLPAQAQLWQIAAFTLLTLLYSLLLWVGLTGKCAQHWYILTFLAQAGCVLVISLVVRQDNVVLSLYLVLILAAIETIQNTRLALLVASSSLLFFVLNELLSRGVLKNWGVALWGIWISTDYAALGLFLIGYLLLYLRSAHAYAQLVTTHAEKDVNRETLLHSIRRAARGETLLQPEVLTRLLSLTQPPLSSDSSIERVKKIDKPELTERERSILTGVARGERSKEIAARLGITAATVAAHLTNIYAKLGADSRASAVAIALQRGLLSMEEENDIP